MASQFGMLIVLARAESPIEVGYYAWGLAVCAPIFMLFSLRVQQVQVLDAVGRFGTNDYLRQRAASMTLAVAVVATVAVVSNRPSQQILVLLAVACFRAVEGFLETLYGEMMRAEAMSQIAMSQVLRAVGGLGAFSGTLAVGGGVVAAVAASSLWSVVTVGIAFRVMKPFARVAVVTEAEGGARRVIQITVFALPIGLAFFVGGLTVNVPRILIESQYGPFSLAVFTAAAYVLLAGNAVVDALVGSASPRMAALVLRGGVSELRRLVWRLNVVAAVLGILFVATAWALGEFVLTLLFGPAYGDGNLILIALAFAAWAQYHASISRMALMALGARSSILGVSLGVCIITLLASVLLLPKYESLGAALSIALGQLFAVYIYFYILVRISFWRARS